MTDGAYSAALKAMQELERRVSEAEKRAAAYRSAKLEAEKRIRDLEKAAALSPKGTPETGGGPDKEMK
ncbi:MAG: hypothetical protein LBW85_04610 [Deltaproteobacteria bacterium]|nr:hypothetical protein [Deltaproteobacteria bacterium]